MQTRQLPGTGQRPVEVEQVGPRDLEEAVATLIDARAFGGQQLIAGFLDHARRSQLSLDLFWGVRGASGQFAASLLAVISPGRTAMLFANRCRGPADRANVTSLIRHAMERLASERVELAQTLIEPGREDDVKAYRDAGLIHLARLSYMERRLPASLPAAMAVPGNVQLVNYDGSLEGELSQALERSYEQTLDCPGLCGLRDTSDILIGHRATGRFEPGLWTMLRLDGRMSGMLLLNPSPLSKTIELVYLGLVPEARGRGLGRMLLRHGLSLLAGRDERSVQLAVDDANSPAIRLYRREGFHRVLRRIAMVRSLRSGERAADRAARVNVQVT
jgi:ribosomal protein S18 acetylase RimI-like enzyme